MQPIRVNCVDHTSLTRISYAYDVIVGWVSTVLKSRVGHDLE